MSAYIVAWLVAANMIAFALMILDKKFAANGARRISENTLLSWAFLGGAAGIFAASHFIRHKTRKQPFAAQLIAILILENILLGLWMPRFLDPLLRH